ncbi:MAG: helix-turn-helix transcriptional regulator, partial [Elusimicrobiota bacterium]|nr:helix-turn-helix transcriptional regulator [Elusimicrobiota bacterium]
MTLPPFARLVSEALSRRGLGLRELCRRARLDPSLISKVLAGKRSPPWDEAGLRRLADALELDAALLSVAAGRLPPEWEGLARDPELLRRVGALVTGRSAAQRPSGAPPAP